MEALQEILKTNDPDRIINYLKNIDFKFPEWEKIRKEYEPTEHEIVSDKRGRVDKIHDDGTKEEAARIYIGLEQLLTKRITEFTFAIPVKRVYYNADSDVRKEIVRAIEKIYTANHINSVNIKRGIDYYSTCNLFTLWYVKEEKNNLYGFDSDYKLKCKTYSPSEGVKIYPLFDDKDDLIALSYEYSKKQTKDFEVTYFETYTADAHYIWKMGTDSVWEKVSDLNFNIGKIPAAFISREAPIWDGLTVLRKDLEYTLSRNSDVVAYNCAPILKVAGTLVGEVTKGETKRVYRVTEGGDISYVSWQQAIEALKYHVDTLIKLYFMQSQMPDISFENMKTLGNIGYDSRKTLLSDAHMKIGEEGGPITEFLEREGNVIKAFLKKMNTKWENEIDAIEIEHIITPFVQEDEKSEIEKWQTASGGKALISQLDAIKLANLTDDPERTYKDIKAEETQDAASRMAALGTIMTEE